MGAMSRRKGKRGELEACRALELALGGQWRRSANQGDGGKGRPDVVSDQWPGLHVEVKRQKQPNLWAALAQAMDDADGRVPLVVARRDNEDWVCVIGLRWLQRLLAELRDVEEV